MLTWQIMLGFQALTAFISLGVVVNFMLKKEPLDLPAAEALPAKEAETVQV